MSFPRFFNLVVVASLTILLTTTVLLNFGTSNAFAATLPVQFASHLQFSVTNRAEAITKNLEGKAQEAIGNLTGDPKDQIMGKAKQSESQVRNAAEDINDQIQLKTKIKADAKNLEGKAQEAIGNMTGNSRDQIMGKAKQAEGQGLNLIEYVKEKIQNIFQ